MQSFQEEYQRLNEAQKKAVDSIEGPVMVVAGPGTGKTQVIAMRVASILQKTQMRPGNILCLTFSVSGATAMRERLRTFIGGEAYGVTIRNFHGFCNDLIGAYPGVFEDWEALEQVSDLERYRIVNTIIDGIITNSELLNQKSPYMRSREIIGKISEVKREGKTVADLLAAADKFDEEMATKSREGTKIHEKNLATARKFREFITIFEGYQKALKESNRYDYEDMILYVIEALQKEEWLLQQLQERYQYILVDEFQDTNGSQYKLLQLLTQYIAVDHEPNLFVVGDDDQAIYRFQGANLQNILQFHTRFPKAEVIVLTENYRSTQPILDAATRLISQNAERLVNRMPNLQKILHSNSKEKKPEPTLVRPVSDTAESWMIADIIADELKKGAEPQEIAILVQKNSELLPVYDVLRAREIPVQMTGKLDLLHHPLVAQVVAILKAILEPGDNGLFAAALACTCFECHPADLGRIFSLQREEKKSVREILLSFDEPESAASKLVLVNKEAVLNARNTLLDLHQKIDTRTVVETLEQALKTTGLLKMGKEHPSFDPVDFAALQAFFDRMKYRAYEQPTFSLRQLLSDIDLYERPEYGDLRLSFSLPHLTEEGVQLMTAHQSKGLEFDMVILPNFREGHWDKRRTPSSISIPEHLLYGWEKEDQAFASSQDERRIAFVAMTRARKTLIFSCPKEVTNADKAREVSPSGFFAEAGPLPEEDRELKNPEDCALLLIEPKIDLDEAMRAFLKERLEQYALSVTALNHFLEDPQKFLELDLLQIPQTKESSLVYGNAVHFALKSWSRSVQENQPLSEGKFIAEFDSYLDEREVLTSKERERLRALGHTTLPVYYNERLLTAPIVYKYEWPISCALEDPSDTTGARIPLKGMLDRVDSESPDSAIVSVVDYKTGRPQTEAQIRSGDYHRQLVFYGLLLREAQPALKPKTYTLDFVGERGEEPIERVFQISAKEIEDLAELVRKVWHKIQALDFTPVELPKIDEIVSDEKPKKKSKKD